MNYSEKLKDPRWQKKRLEILNRDAFTCRKCSCTTHTLHVHHLHYESGKEPWDYDNKLLITLCWFCHEEEEMAKKEAEKIIVSFLSAGFLHSDLLEPFSGLLASAISDFGKKDFDCLISRMALNAELRLRIKELLKIDLQTKKTTPSNPVLDDLPF